MATIKQYIARGYKKLSYAQEYSKDYDGYSISVFEAGFMVIRVGKQSNFTTNRLLHPDDAEELAQHIKDIINT